MGASVFARGMVSAPRCTAAAGEPMGYRTGVATGDSDEMFGAKPPVPQSVSSIRSHVTLFLLLPVVPEVQPTHPSFVRVPFVAARTVQ